MSKLRPSLDIVVVNWKALPALQACARSVDAALADVPVDLRRLVVIDNGSGDDLGALSFPASVKPHAEIVQNRENLGLAAAINQGAAGSEADYLLLLNPDIRLTSTSLGPPLETLEAPGNADIGIVGIQLLDDEGRVSRSCARFPTPWRLVGQSVGLDRVAPRIVPPHFMKEWPHDETRPVDQVMGAFLLVRRKLFEKLGGFDDRFFLYYEDVDFCRRAWDSGSRVVYVASAQAYHSGGVTTASIPALSLYFSLRSKLAYSRKHFGVLSRCLVFCATMVLEPLSRGVCSLLGRSRFRLRHVAKAMGLLIVPSSRKFGRKTP